MTTESVYALFCDIDLRQHIIDTAKRLSGNKKVQKDLVGHAWYRLGEADGQKTMAYYKQMCSLFMERRRLLIMYREVFIT